MKTKYKLLVLALLLIPIILFSSCIDGEAVDANARIINQAGVAKGINSTAGSLDVNVTGGSVSAVVPNPLPVSINGVTLNEGNLPVTSYYYLIADGAITNHVVWDDLGYLGSASNSTLTIWDGATNYVWPAVAQQMEIVSSSTNDTLAGTGVQKVKIYYLDASGTEFTEVVSLNGTGVVTTTATNIYRVNDFMAYQVGVNGVAAGNIVLRNLTDTPIYSQISTGFTRDRSVVYTVPKNKHLFITSITFGCVYSTAGKSERFTFLGTYNNVDNVMLPANFFVPYSETLLVDNSIVRTFEVPFKLPSLTDFKVNVIGETNAQCSVVMRGWLEPN